MEIKLATIQIEVPYRGPGNIMMNKPVQFDVIKDEEFYKAVPLLDTSERRQANLPPELTFRYKDGKADSERGQRDGNLHVILDIVEALKANSML